MSENIATENQTEKPEVVQISTDEKLVSRELEVAFLRATADLQAAQQRITQVQQSFEAHVKALTAKYGVESTHIYDVVASNFRKIATAA